MGNSGPFVETTSVPDNTFSRGHLSLGPAGGSCALCDTNSKYEIIDRTGGELMQVYEELAYKPEAAVYAEVPGRKGMRPEEGTKQLTILQLLHAAVETRGCAEDLHGLSFRAVGIQVGAAAQLIEFICNTTDAAEEYRTPAFVKISASFHLAGDLVMELVRFLPGPPIEAVGLTSDDLQEWFCLGRLQVGYDRNCHRRESPTATLW